MAKLTVEHQEEILTFPTDSILELKIEECNTKEVTSTRDGSSWTKLEFKFKVLGIQALGDGGNPSDYENWITKHIWGSVPAKLTNSPENRLRIWAEAAFQMELGVGFELDTDMFIGRTVRGLTSQYDARGRAANGQPLKRHQIETLLPFGGTGGQAPMQPAPPQAAAPASDPWAPQQPAPAASGGNPWGDSWGKSDEPPF